MTGFFSEKCPVPFGSSPLLQYYESRFVNFSLDKMTLTVNGNKKDFENNLNLKELLNHLDLNTDRNGVALCVNMQVIPKEEWDNTSLSEGDKIEIVIAAPGG